MDEGMPRKIELALGVMQDLADLPEAVFGIQAPAQAAYMQGWWLHSMELGQCVVLLCSVGRYFETAPLLRTLTEHVASVTLLGHQEDIWRVHENSLLYDMKKLQKYLDEKTEPHWPDLDRVVENIARPTPSDDPRKGHLGQMRARCDRLDQLGEPGTLWYKTWAYFTHYSHASLPTAILYTPQESDRRKGQPPMHDLEPEVTATLLMFDATRAMNRVTRGHVWTDVLDEIRDRLTTIVDLPLEGRPSWSPSFGS